MKKFLYLTYIIAFVFQVYQAQAQGRNMQNINPEEMAKRQTAMLKDSLSLSEEQTTKIDAIHLKYAEKMKKIAESDAEQMEKFQEFQVLRTNQDFEIKKVLDKEQAKKFQAMREAQRARRQRQGGDRN